MTKHEATLPAESVYKICELPIMA